MMRHGCNPTALLGRGPIPPIRGPALLSSTPVARLRHRPDGFRGGALRQTTRGEGCFHCWGD